MYVEDVFEVEPFLFDVGYYSFAVVLRDIFGFILGDRTDSIILLILILEFEFQVLHLDHRF